jgi:transcriptional regulator with XRE-family HTH domain
MRLGEVLRRWRKMSDMGIREAAAEIGVSHGTLSRIERGEEMSGSTLAKVLGWLTAREKVKK